MKERVETVEIPVEFLTELLNMRREYFIICDIFKIPMEKRGQGWVGKAIVERIHTYITSYILRRSMIEKETGAAFREELARSPLPDPILPETPGE